MNITAQHPAIYTTDKIIVIGREYYYIEYDYPLPKMLCRLKVRVLQAEETPNFIKLFLETTGVYDDRYNGCFIGKKFHADQQTGFAEMWTLSELE